MYKVLLFLFLLVVNQFVYADRLLVNLFTPQASYKADERLLIGFELHNDSSQTLKILKWHTPLEQTFNADMFDVYLDNKAVSYLGRKVKRRPPQDSDYITLLPNAKISQVIDLEEGYDIDQTGYYHISYKNEQLKYKAPPTKANNIQTTNAKQARPLLLKQSAPVTVYMTRGKKKLKTSNPISSLKQAPTFNACSTSRQNILNNALDEAENIALVAKNALNNAPAEQRSNATRYTTWFGSYDVNRYHTVDTNFTNIANALASQTMDLDCACAAVADPANTYAYVYPNQPYTISLCGAFWNASLTGRDSQSGVLIHELSHFTILAGTDDHAYGQTNAINLALTDPTQAVDNAENHEYFAENTPSLFMPVVSTTTASTHTILQTPSPVIATTQSANQINLSWASVASASYYYLYQASTTDGSYHAVYAGSGVNHSQIHLTHNTTYYYKLKACAAIYTSTCSNYSGVASATTLDVFDDHGSSISNATVININTSTTGVIDFGGDNDYFALTITSNGTLTIDTTSGIDTYGYLLNSSGSTIISDDDSGANTNFRIQRLISAGSYYVRVRHYFSSSTGNYTLNTSFTTVQPSNYVLTANISGSGTITSNPAGINCGSDCSQTYNTGTAVTLTANPDTGYVFNNWGGSCSGNNTIFTFVLNTDTACQANFVSSVDTDGDGIPDVTDTDDDNDGLPDTFETANGLDPLDASDASSDLDGDGFSNLEEYQFNTLINDSSSIPLYQTVAVDGGDRNILPNSTVSLSVNYSVSDNDNTLTGLGLRVHFNQANLLFVNTTNTLLTGFITANSTPIADSNDFDNNPNTSHYIGIAWSSAGGNWPNQTLPSKLFDINFLPSNNFTVGSSTIINFSVSSLASGYEFKQQPSLLTLSDLNLDIDGNNNADALTDGLLVIRYLFGFRGNTLISNVVDSNATRVSITDIENYLSRLQSSNVSDIDGNNNSDALTDGLLIIRYLFGFRNDTLTSSATATDANRGGSEIEGYLDSIVGQ